MGLKMIGIIALFLIVLGLVNNKRIITDEVISHERLRTRLNTFNNWYKDFTGKDAKVEARLTDDPNWTRIGLFAKEEVKEEEVFLTVERTHLIRADLIYETKLGNYIKELEAKYGYDDYTNFVFFLLHEMNNKDSVWKAYLDLLPRQLTSVAYKYWDKKRWIEDELLHTPILKKIIDYKFLLEKKARNYYHAIVSNNTELFDPEWFNEENLEWACMILDSRLVYIDFEAFLAPMVDFANYAENKQHPERIFKAKFDADYKVTEFKSQSSVRADDQLFVNLGFSNDNYLLYHGIVLKENSYDCFSVSLTFSERQDDNLREERKVFFARYFLFDKNQVDEINECISLKNPYPRRLLFFYYTLMMDEIDLQKPDPKRSGLETDRIIVEYVKNAFQTFLDLYSTSAENDQSRADKEPETYKRNILQYQVEQKTYLAKLIEVYNDLLNKLNKEDVL